MLEFIYYPVSFILWCWHWVFGHIFGEASAISWALGIVFLVFTLRAVMLKPSINQIRSMRKMQAFAPEIKKLQAKYKNDRQKLQQEMAKLQQTHGVNPLGGCLPMLLQIPVFIGLFHVLKEFKPGKTENYFFDARGVESYIDADLFGARLSNWITQPAVELAQFSVSRGTIVAVAIPLALAAAALTHLNGRHSVSRQDPAAATPQTAIMNKLILYIFPLGVIASAFFFPIGLLIYFMSNNGWTYGQQHYVYRKIDAEDAAKKVAATEKRNAQAPKPGQKPVQPKKGAATAKPADDAESTTPADDAKPTTGTSKPLDTSSGTEIPGLISDRSRKKSGRKNR